MSVEVWAEINSDGDTTRYHSPNGQQITSGYDGKGKYSVNLGGNFELPPYVLASVRADDGNPTNKVVSVITAQKNLVKIGVKADRETSKRPFTIWAYQP